MYGSTTSGLLYIQYQEIKLKSSLQTCIQSPQITYEFL